MLTQDQVLDNGRYRIETHLSRGGMGSVYLAVDNNLQVQVAIKENLLNATRQRQQFEREAALLYRLKHPNLPSVTNYFTESSDRQYLVMEYVDGQNLQEILHSQRGYQAEEEVLFWIEQVMDALTYMHAWTDTQTGQTQPILHRDIKPSNIKLTPQGEIFLVDFGLAKPESLGTTISGARGVTPGFSPPEQYAESGGRTTPQTDIYALGATLYALLTKRIPPAATQIIGGVETLHSPCLVNTTISPETERVILKAMQLNVADRYQSIEEMRQALRGSKSASWMSRAGSRVSGPVAKSQTKRMHTQPPVRRQPTFLRTLIGLLLTAIVMLFGFIMYEQVTQVAALDGGENTLGGGGIVGGGGGSVTATTTPTPTATIHSAAVTALPPTTLSSTATATTVVLLPTSTASATATSVPPTSTTRPAASTATQIPTRTSTPTRLSTPTRTSTTMPSTPTRKPIETATQLPPTITPTPTFTLPPTPQPTVSPTVNHSALVLDVIRTEIQYGNARDLQSILSLWSENGVIVSKMRTADDPSDDILFTGIDSIRTFYQSFFDLDWIEYDLVNPTVIRIDGNTASVTHQGTFSDGVHYRDVATYVLTKQNGEWKFLALEVGTTPP